MTLDKVIYVGFSILGLSKLLMYEFHYKYIKRKYNAKLLITDTDSLVYETEAKDVDEDFCKDRDLFDFSGYPQDSKFFDLANKKVIGKMKHEVKREVISEFVKDGKEVKKVNGVNKNVVKSMRRKEFVDVLFNKKIIRHNLKIIQSKLHRIGTYDICKIFLPSFDDKRYALDESISTLAYFHKDIKSQ